MGATSGYRGRQGTTRVRVRPAARNREAARATGSGGLADVRWPLGCRDPKEFKYFLSNAPRTVSLAALARVGCLRWTIEENFELAKGELGLDHYEVTRFRGWYHYITQVLLALAFLKSVQCGWGKKGVSATLPQVPQIL